MEEELAIPETVKVEQILMLKDLPVMASVTSPWPLPESTPSAYQFGASSVSPMRKPVPEKPKTSDDETDEMDTV